MADGEGGATRRGHLLALGAAVVWSINFALIRHLRLDEGLGPVGFCIMRFAMGAAVAGVLMSWRRPKLAGLGRRGWVTLVLLAVLIGPVFQIMVSGGARTTSSGIMGMLIGSQPLHIAWLGALLLGERARPMQWLAILVAYVGVSLPLAFGEKLDLESGLTGPLVIFAASIVAALNAVLPRSLRHRLASWDMVLMLMVLGLAASLPLLRVGTVEQWGAMSARGWGAMFYVAVPGQLVAVGLWYAALWRLNAATVAYYLFVMMVLAAGWGWVLQDERLTVWHAVGLACVGAGLVINTRSSMRAAARASATDGTS